MEEFKDIAGYEGMYQVSNLGRVKSLARKSSAGRNIQERIRKTPINFHGYPMTILSKDAIRKTITVHQLVAIAFLGHIPKGKSVHINHIDFDRTNNNVKNLEITTPRENGNKKHLKSSSKYTGVCLHKATNKWSAQIYLNGKIKYLGLFKCEIAASVAYQKALNTFNEN